MFLVQLEHFTSYETVTCTVCSWIRAHIFKAAVTWKYEPFKSRYHCPLVKLKDKKMWRTKMKVLKVALFDLKRCNFMTPKCHSFLDIIYKYSSLNVFGTPTCNRDKHTNILKTNDQAFFFSRRVRKSAGGKGMKDCLISVVNILNI